MDEATNISAKPQQPASHDLGSVPFSGRPDALFERHLLSDAVVEPSGAYDRQRFEALARSVRDLLSRRWIKTQRTYDQQNPKRIYYMSMEFLIGRSLTNNVTNLMLKPFIERSAHEG
ncbi:MAG: glycogen phosphorylase, partial [Pseudomonadota bacterium]|nr:glycogen phosphorylase [Pseudomonadota bacterium]